MYLCGLDKVSKVLSACVFKITIIIFKGNDFTAQYYLQHLYCMYHHCEDTCFVCWFYKSSSLTVLVRFKRWFSFTSCNTEASTEVMSYPFCILYHPICQILVRLASLLFGSSLGFIWNVWRHKPRDNFLKTRSLLVVTEGGWHNRSLSDRTVKHSLHMISGFRWEWLGR